MTEIRTTGPDQGGVAVESEQRRSTVIRDRALSLVEGLLADGTLTSLDLRRFVTGVEDPFEPEALRQDFESWFKAFGIEQVTGRRFSLGECPFTREELTAASSEGWIPVVSPQGLTLAEVSETLHLPTWATTDPLVTSPPEEEDLWFLTPGSLTPEDGNKSARELRKAYDAEGWLGLSLQRYMIVAARLRHLTGEAPDARWWTWIMRGRYDRSGFMIAGFDPNGSFSVHAWMPEFRAGFVGSRPIRICPRIAPPPDVRRSRR